MNQVIARWRAVLNTNILTDASRGTLLAGIQKVAPQSPLMQDPMIAASYAALVTKGATLATNVTGAAAARAQFATATDLRDVSRNAFDLQLVAFKTLVEANATSGNDITGTGFPLFLSSKASQTPPDPPSGGLIVKLGKAHGKARVSVPAANRGRFLAEMATDPAGPWSSLPGTGRQRKLAGASGTKIWVRFAAVRYGMQSDWCTPVLVTLP
jgi:hypothetical protein